MNGQVRYGVAVLVATALAALLIGASRTEVSTHRDGPQLSPASPASLVPAGRGDRHSRKVPKLTLAIAGDVHFEAGLVELLGRPRSTLGPMSRALRSADLAMVNLESALTSGGAPASKELEEPGSRYWFRSPPAALDLLDRSGVDVVSVANNHGADYGLRGLRDTLRIAQRSPVAVVGAGLNQRRAFRPYRVSIRGTDVAVLAADASPRESADPLWGAAPGAGPGLASARVPRPRALIDAVREADRRNDLTVVYLHWGEEKRACPTPLQQGLARSLSAAGADVVVGTHAHVLLGSGMLGDTYVSYGLGNFHWYHGEQSETGVLRLRLRGGEVVGEEWRPARIPPVGGAPGALTGAARAEAVKDWRGLRGCTELAPGPGTGQKRDGDRAGQAARNAVLPPFTSKVRRIGPGLRVRMRSSHDPGACPVPLADLRLLQLSHVGYDGRAHPGAMVVHADVAGDVVGVFASLYRARFPIQRMRLVDAYGGDDNRSMAANNTSGYNCRRVAGQDTFSDHAYGRAIDINPVQNPYVRRNEVLPPAGRRFVSVDRSPGAASEPGVIRDGDVVTRAFGRLGWTWGGNWTDPDFQHFSAP